MKRNYYYLIVGILAILFSFTHIWNGQSAVLPALDASNVTASLKTVFFYVWHIISIENVIFGIAFIIMAFHKDLSKVRFTAWLIAAIMIGRWIVIFGSTLLRSEIGISGMLTDTIAIFIFTVLIILGTGIKNKEP